MVTSVRRNYTRFLPSVTTTVRELGWLNTLLYWMDSVCNILFRKRVRIRRYFLVVQPLAINQDDHAAPQTTLLVTPLTPEKFEDDYFPVSSVEIRRRFDQGSHCLVARIAGRFAGYIWIHTGPFVEDEVSCTFVPTPASTVCWDFDVYVEPQYRATRTFLRLWQAAARSFRAEGYTHTASRISAFNAASLKAHVRSGARIVGSAIFLSAGRIQMSIVFMRSKSILPRISFSRSVAIPVPLPHDP